jgi:hypothetical protein
MASIDLRRIGCDRGSVETRCGSEVEPKVVNRHFTFSLCGSDYANFAGTKNITATGNSLACGLLYRAWIAAAWRSISAGTSFCLVRLACCLR